MTDSNESQSHSNANEGWFLRCCKFVWVTPSFFVNSLVRYKIKRIQTRLCTLWCCFLQYLPDFGKLVYERVWLHLHIWTVKCFICWYNMGKVNIMRTLNPIYFSFFNITMFYITDLSFIWRNNLSPRDSDHAIK